MPSFIVSYLFQMYNKVDWILHLIKSMFAASTKVKSVFIIVRTLLNIWIWNSSVKSYSFDWMNVFEFPMLFSAFCAANTQAHKSINHLPDAHLWYHWSMMHILYTHPSENCQHTFFFKTIKHLPCDTFHWTKKTANALHLHRHHSLGLWCACIE